MYQEQYFLLFIAIFSELQCFKSTVDREVCVIIFHWGHTNPAHTNALNGHCIGFCKGSFERKKHEGLCKP